MNFGDCNFAWSDNYGIFTFLGAKYVKLLDNLTLFLSFLLTDDTVADNLHTHRNWIRNLVGGFKVRYVL